MKTQIETAYAPANDITFIMEYTYTDNGEPVTVECVGWYYGEPNADAVKKYYRSGMTAEI